MAGVSQTGSEERGSALDPPDAFFCAAAAQPGLPAALGRPGGLLLGSQTSKIAYPLLVLAMTGSPAKAGIAGFAAMLGYLLFPLLAGGVADRHDRKRILIACDAIRLAAVGSIAVAGWVAHITYVQVLVAGFLEGAATVFFGVAQRAALPMLVLARRNGASSAEIGLIVGCMGAGGLVGRVRGPLVPAADPGRDHHHRLHVDLDAAPGADRAGARPRLAVPDVAVLGFVGPAWNVSAQTYRMQITPNEMMGRTSSVAVQMAWGVIPLGSLLAGFLLQVLSPAAAMAVVAAGWR